MMILLQMKVVSIGRKVVCLSCACERPSRTVVLALPTQEKRCRVKDQSRKMDSRDREAPGTAVREM